MKPHRGDATPILAVAGLTKVYGAPSANGPRVLDGVSFDVAPGEFFTLLGPSGCGKTTMLQCIAGLEQPSGGYIAMGGAPVFDAASGLAVPAHQRDLGMVFQSYAIWPHMTVFDNVAFPLLHGPRPCPKAEIAPRVHQALERVQLAHLATREAPQLSGGQQQRVALARALVHAPRLLLLDEPLSNLDAQLRDTMRTELRALVKSLGIATIFVTHDQVEAMSMSDRVALMRAGRVVQVGTPREIYLRPNSAFTASFLGHSNLIAGAVRTADTVQTVLGMLRVDTAGFATGTAVSVVARPPAITWCGTDAPSGTNQCTARVAALQFIGDEIEVDLDCAGLRLRMVADPYTALTLGADARICLVPERLVVVPRDETDG